MAACIIRQAPVESPKVVMPRHFDWNRGYFKPVTGFVTRCGLCYPNTPLASRFRSS
jgi:hypothetical protein